MKTPSKFVALRVLGVAAVAAVVAACGDARATDAARQEDLERDLDLASATTMALASAQVDSALLNSLETAPRGEPSAATTLKQGDGSRAVRSSSPTVRATPEVSAAAVDEDAQTETLAEAPAPEALEPVAVAPRPAPPVVIATGSPAGDYGTGGSDGGIFGGGMGGGGVIIRGGGVDGDNCELHTRGGRRGTSRGPIYVPTVPVAAQPSGPQDRSRGVGGIGSAGTDRRAPTTRPAAPATGTTPRSRPTTRRGF